MVARSGWMAVAVALGWIAGCAADRASRAPGEAVGSTAPPSPTVAVSGAAVGPVAPASSAAAAHPVSSAPPAPPPATAVRSKSDEKLIRAFVDLDREGAELAALERFVAAHPELLSAQAKPYGSALMWALEYEHANAALVLIRAGAALETSSQGGAGPLHIAARGGLDAIVSELLARGASPNAADYWGTPLHFAAKQGHASTMRLLLAAGADPNAHAQDHQYTPLHEAVTGRHLDAIRVLIGAKADLEATDDDGQTPLHWGGFAYVPQAVHRYARLGGPHDTTFVDPGPAKAVKLLLDAGADMEATDKGGNTPLHAAAEVGSRRGVQMLLSRGARRGVKNHAGETPLDFAKRRGDDDIVRLLGGR